MTTARILLIDDDVDLLDMLTMYLERDGFSVTATDVAATWYRLPTTCSSERPRRSSCRIVTTRAS
jgi:DNA-binding NtrC family response regulator